MSNQIVDGYSNPGYVMYWLNKANQNGAVNTVGQMTSYVVSDYILDDALPHVIATIPFDAVNSAYAKWSVAAIAPVSGLTSNGFSLIQILNTSGTPVASQIGTLANTFGNGLVCTLTYSSTALNTLNFIFTAASGNTATIVCSFLIEVFSASPTPLA